MKGVVLEGLLGAGLIGLMVLLFLRDWRSVVIVVLNIPLALAGSMFAPVAHRATINLMTLGGLALAVGILVDESTVEVENIHTQMDRTDSVARAVRQGNAETAVPRLLAMLCILAVFIPSFFMEGALRALFVPLALAVGFAMIGSYILSSTFVPVMSVWLLQGEPGASSDRSRRADSGRSRSRLARTLSALVAMRWLVVPAYLVGVAALIWFVGRPLGTEIFPDRRCRTVPVPAAGPDRHAHRADRATDGAGARRHRRGGGQGQCRHLARLGRRRAVGLSDQRGLPVHRRAGGGGVPRRAQAGQRRPDRRTGGAAAHVAAEKARRLVSAKAGGGETPG